MRERPILFSGEMVRAILDGRKTQTRRVCKPMQSGHPTFYVDGAGALWQDDGLHERVPCPYGQPGDRLWVRETHAVEPDGRVVYQTDRAARHFDLLQPPTPTSDVFWLASDYEPARWRPSIHMPRWASRISLDVTGVRVERLHEITGRDVLAEGVDNGSSNPTMGNRWELMQQRALADLWNSINSERGYGWGANPWIWVVEFKRAEVAHA